MLKKQFLVNAIDAGILGAISIALPLLLLERKIDVSTIGLIFSALPLVYLIVRLLSASISDQIGFKSFFLLNGLFNLFHVLIYLIASNPLLYLVGKIFEGMKTAFIWSVNRSAILLNLKSEKPYIQTSTLMSARLFAYSFGVFIAGLILEMFSFNFLFYCLIVFSIISIAVASFFQSNELKANAKKTISNLDFRNKSVFFWKSSLAMSAAEFASSILFTLVIPIFMASKGFGFGTIGIAIAFYFAVKGLAIELALKKQVSPAKASLWSMAFFCPFAIIAFFADLPLLFACLFFMAIGDGLSNIVWEADIVNAVKSSKNLSSDIGLLHAPTNIADMLSLISFGMIIQFFGFLPTFAISAIAFAAFSVFSLKLLKESNSIS